MNVNMIGDLVNDLVENATDGAFNSVNASNIVSIGDTILNTSENIEKFYSALADRIGKVVIKSLEYTPSKRGIRVDALDFGVAIEKIKFEMGEFSDSSTMWDSDEEQFNPFSNSVNTYAYAKIYKKFSEYEYRDLIPDKQLRSAFVDMAHMGAFLSGLYVTRQNALKIALEELDNTAIAYAIGKTVITSQGDAYARYSINELYKYNHDVLGLSCTVGDDDAIVYPDGWIKVADLETPTSKEFWRWFVRDLKEKIGYVKKYTTLYNPEGREGFTLNPVVEIIGKVASACKVFMESDTFHNDIVSLPNYNEIDFWQSIGTESFSDVTKVAYADDEVDGDDITTYEKSVAGVIVHIRDNDTVMSMVRDFRERSIYNPAAEVTNTFDKATLGFLCDLSETSVVLSVADPTVATSGETSVVDYHAHGLFTAVEKD